jgi:hypothetical protein
MSRWLLPLRVFDRRDVPRDRLAHRLLLHRRMQELTGSQSGVRTQKRLHRRQELHQQPLPVSERVSASVVVVVMCVVRVVDLHGHFRKSILGDERVLECVRVCASLNLRGECVLSAA